MRILDGRRSVQDGLNRRATASLVVIGTLVVPQVRARGPEGPPAPPSESAPAEKKTPPPEVTAPTAKAPAPAAAPSPIEIMTPITVSGRATDGSGKPVAGATISLVSTNGKNASLGSTTTDQDGRYTFRDAQLPVRAASNDAPLAGTFQVYGTAPGRGFAWHGMRFYEPDERPADRRVGGEDHTLFLGEPLVMDLTFPPEDSLGGRVVDEAGKPVAGAKIKLSHCDYLDTAGKETHHNFREFWCLGQAPASLRLTTTDQDGRFRLGGLPQETGFWIHVEHPDFAWKGLYAATTNRPTTAFDYPAGRTSDRTRPAVFTGELNLTLRSTRRIAVRVVYGDTGRPVSGIRLSAGTGTAGVSSFGISDAEGRLMLRLPPGEYDVRADPPRKGSDCVRTLSKLTVADGPADQSHEVRVTRGCVLILEAVDETTGKGVPDVTFMEEAVGHPGIWQSAQVSTAYVEDARTDENGQLRAVVPPGERTYAVGHIAELEGYPQQRPERRVTLIGGETLKVRFKLHK